MNGGVDLSQALDPRLPCCSSALSGWVSLWALCSCAVAADLGTPYRLPFPGTEAAVKLKLEEGHHFACFLASAFKPVDHSHMLVLAPESMSSSCPKI